MPEIQEKKKNTFLLHYDTENPFQLPEIKEKIRQTFYSHYGVDNPNKSPEVRAKTAQTLYKNGTTPTSKQQFYVFNLYQSVNPNTQLNYPIAYYNVDICFPEEKLTVEIDFGGHDLQVKTGNLTQEEFNQKEIIRNNIIKREGYKQMRIISLNDKLPQDSVLFQMLSEARQYFSDYPEHSWIEYNISTSTLRNAENKNGIPYNFGELRTIKDADLSRQSVS